MSFFDETAYFGELFDSVCLLAKISTYNYERWNDSNFTSWVYESEGLMTKLNISVKDTEKHIAMFNQIHSKGEAHRQRQKDAGKLLPNIDGCISIRGKNDLVNGPIVCTDGSRDENSSCGIGVFWGVDNVNNVSQRLNGCHSINTAELRAASRAIKQASEMGYEEMCIRTDSFFLIFAATEFVPFGDRKFWTSLGEPIWTYHVLKSSIRSMKKIVWEKVRGHSGDFGNEEADRLAKLGRNKICISKRKRNHIEKIPTYTVLKRQPEIIPYQSIEGRATDCDGPIVYVHAASNSAGDQHGFGVFWGFEHRNNISQVFFGTRLGAEVQAVVRALEKAKTIGYKELAIRTNSALLIQKVNEQVSLFHYEPNLNTIGESFELLSAFKCSIEGVKVILEKLENIDDDDFHKQVVKLAEDGINSS